eukprot:SAG31_NODE_26316_length_444_cov_1.049275_1_plen_57_part_10
MLESATHELSCFLLSNHRVAKDAFVDPVLGEPDRKLIVRTGVHVQKVRRIEHMRPRI